MNTIGPAELARRVRRRGLELDERLAREFLHDWEARGIAEQHLGNWQLTPAGYAMFGAWAHVALDNEERAA